MKKLSFLLVAGAMMLFSACNNCNNTETTCNEPVQEVQEHKCCHEMTPEQKAFHDDWANWDNMTAERKAELVTIAKEKFEAKKAECQAKKEAMTEEQKAECAQKEAEMSEECKAKKAEKEAMRAAIDEKMANWDNMNVDEQKALMDEIKANCKCGHKCHKDGQHQCQGGEHKCQKDGEHKCQGGEHKCQKDGEHKCQGGEHKCQKDGEHKDCPNK